MRVEMYHTTGGKNVILDYISSLEADEQVVALTVIKKLKDEGKDALDKLTTRPIIKKDKLWEIKFYRHNRIYYVLTDEVIYLLHACRKQKGKAEKPDINTAQKRLRSI